MDSGIHPTAVVGLTKGIIGGNLMLFCRTEIKNGDHIENECPPSEE